MSINAYSLIITVIILFNEFNGIKERVLQDKLFKAILYLNTLLIILDSFGWMSTWKIIVFNKLLFIIITTLNYILIPLPLILLGIYINYEVFQSKQRILKLMHFFLFPLALNTLLIIVSAFTGIIFYYDNKNLYHRGPLFILLAATCYCYILYPIVFVILNRKIIERKKFLPMLLFPLPTIIGGILQNIFFGLSTMWAGSTISILILFLSIQNSRLNTDYLTGLYNRRQLESYLISKINNNSMGNLFAGIMIDVDDFKSINDLFGHHVGDEALTIVANLLRKCFPKNDLIARYAGDEFVIILDIKNPEELPKAVNRLNNILLNYNSNNSLQYKLNLSLGYDVYDNKSQISSDQFIKQLDSLMYEEKKYKKRIAK